MIDLTPFLLLLVFGSPGAQLTAERVPGLYASEAECIAEGTRAVAAIKATTPVSFVCIALPPREEFDALLNRLEGEAENPSAGE
jgi:hypothetical protein